MRRVRIVGSPPQDWIDEASELTASLRKITEVFDAENFELEGGLTAKEEMSAPRPDHAVLGNVNGKLRLRVANQIGDVIFDQEESFLRANWRTRVAKIWELLPHDWGQSLPKPQRTSLAKELKEIVRLAFTKRNESHWRDDRVRNWLLSQFENKCWYSEASDSVSPIHVEHFRPKSSSVDDQSKHETEGYWWMAFDWQNYRIGGHYLNTRKGDFFPLHNTIRATACGGVPRESECPVIIDPITDSAGQISFERQEDVCIAVCSDEDLDENHEDRVEVERTLKILGLNEYDRLNQKRAVIWDECLAQIERYKARAPVPSFKSVIRAGITDRLKQVVDYKAEFSSVAIACIHKKAPLSLINAVFKNERASA